MLRVIVKVGDRAAKCNLERIDLLGARWHASQQWPAVTDHLVDEEPPAQIYLGWADGTRFEVHCCRYPTITEEEQITRIGIPPKHLHFGTRTEEHTSELQS